MTIRPDVHAGSLVASWTALGIVADRVIAYPLPTDVACSWITWENAAQAVVAPLGRSDLAGEVLSFAGGPRLLPAANGKALAPKACPVLS